MIHIKCNQNLFVLDLIKPGKAMAMGRERFIHIVSKNKQIQIWHHQLGHISNARVVRVSKLVDGINIDKAEYNSKEVFIDSNLSKIDKQPISSQ